MGICRQINLISSIPREYLGQPMNFSHIREESPWYFSCKKAALRHRNERIRTTFTVLRLIPD